MASGDYRRAFGSIRKLGSGRFQARYRGTDGLDHKAPMTYTRKSDADAYLATIQADMARATWRAPVTTNESLADYTARWIDQHNRLKATTRAMYDSLNRLHISGTELGPVRLSELTADRIRTWYADLVKSLAASTAARPRNSPATGFTGASTAARTYRLLHAVLATATEDGMFVKNPCQIKGAGTTKRTERPIASPAEVNALAEAMPERYYAMVQLAAWTGARVGELAALRRRDLDLEGRLLHIEERVYRVNGVLDWDTPKSEAGRRTIALPPHLVPILAGHLEEYTGADPDDLVFTTGGGKPIEGAGIGPIWARARKKVGRDDLRFHDLRHTGQTLAAIAGGH